MTDFRWDPLKNELLKRTRGVSFEEILLARFIRTEDHPKRPHQRLMLFELGDYVWIVPVVIKGDETYLKTAYPSRNYTKQWRMGELE